MRNHALPVQAQEAQSEPQSTRKPRRRRRCAAAQPVADTAVATPTLEQLQEAAIEMLAVWSNENQVTAFTVEPWLMDQWHACLGRAPRFTAHTIAGLQQDISITQTKTDYEVQPAETSAQIIFVW